MATTPPDLDQNAAPRRRRGPPLFLLGALAALLAGLGIAALLAPRDHGADTPPVASEAGLVIESSGGGTGRIDPGKPLRCYVAGQYVGELSLTECAKRNGVATDALDVGLDANGALVGADPAAQTLTAPPAAETPQEPREPGVAPEPPEPARVPDRAEPPYGEAPR